MFSTTISNSLSKVTKAKRTVLAPTTKQAAVNNNLRVTSDMWTDYLHTPTVTLGISATHHIDDNWILQNMILLHPNAMEMSVKQGKICLRQ